MCGIIGILVKNPKTVVRDMKLIWKEQDGWGKNGSGYSINTAGILIRKRFKITDDLIRDKIFENLIEGDAVVIHHRQPTSTPNQICYNHPIASEDGRIHLSHYGVFYNDKSVFKRHTEQGHKYETFVDGKFTDTEIAVHELEQYPDLEVGLRKIQDTLEGWYHLFITEIGNKGMLIFDQKGSFSIWEKDGNKFCALADLEHLGFKFVRKLEAGEIMRWNE